MLTNPRAVPLPWVFYVYTLLAEIDTWPTNG